MNRRLLLAAVFAAPVAALAAQAATAFRDIPPGHWARKPAGILADHKIMTGRTPVDFAGEVPLTRYELAMILSALHAVEGPPATFVVLRDMPTGHEATLDVQRVLGYDLMKARKPGVFEGSEGVTRREMAEALDTLLEKNGVQPPARKRNPVFFSDIPAASPTTAILDRVVNRFALMEGKSGAPFYPINAVTRFQVLAMLVKLMPYVNPAVDREIREATRATPGPVASLAPGETPAPATPAYSDEPTSVPFTFASTTPPPAVAPSGGPILRSRVRGGAEMLVAYLEGLPTEPGMIAAGEKASIDGGLVKGAAVPGGALAGELWAGKLGGTASFRGYYVPLDAPDKSGKPVAADVLDMFGLLGGWFKTGSGADWELALGGQVLIRQQMSQAPTALFGQSYATTDKFYFGGGPGLKLGYRFAPSFDLLTTATVLGIMQTYSLAKASPSLTRVGGDLDLRGVYRLGGGLNLEGGASANLSSAGGGNQTIFGLQLGASYDF